MQGKSDDDGCGEGPVGDRGAPHNLHLLSLIERVRSVSTQPSRVCLVGLNLVDHDLSRLDLDRIDLRRCVLDHANLERTTWRETFAFECSFVNARLGDATLGGARFVDCDLRSADLSVRVVGGAVSGIREVQLERCDLRGANWRGRELERAMIVECKMFGMRGAPSTERAIIVRPDFTPESESSSGQRRTRRRWIH